jgi:hypothetical protein
VRGGITDGVVGWASVGASRDADATATTGELWAILAPGRWRHGVGRAMWAWGQSTSRRRASERGGVGARGEPLRAHFYATVGFVPAPDATKMVEIGG